MENQNKIFYVISLHNPGRTNKNTCERQRMKSLQPLKDKPLGGSLAQDQSSSKGQVPTKGIDSKPEWSEYKKLRIGVRRTKLLHNYLYLSKVTLE